MSEESSLIFPKKSKIEEQFLCPKCDQVYKSVEQYDLHDCLPIWHKVRKALDTIAKREDKLFDSTARVINSVTRWIKENEKNEEVDKSSNLIRYFGSLQCEKCEKIFANEDQIKLHNCQPIWTSIEKSLDEIRQEELNIFGMASETTRAVKKWLRIHQHD